MATSIEPPQREVRPLTARPRWHATALHLAFVPLGLAAGAGGALYAYGLRPDVWLAFFVFAMVTYTLGWGTAEVLARPHRLQRALYFALEPALSAAVLYAASRAGAEMWLAVLLGFFVGGALHTILGWALFPRVTAEETGADRWYAREAGEPSAWTREQARGFFRHPIRNMAVGMMVDRYYTAIKAQDYDAAYGYLGSEPRSTLTRDAFAARARVRDVAEGAVEAFAEVGVDPDDPGSITLAVARPAGTYTVHLRLRRESGAWRVAAFDDI
jgi:hypothetical protein